MASEEPMAVYFNYLAVARSLKAPMSYVGTLGPSVRQSLQLLGFQGLKRLRLT